MENFRPLARSHDEFTHKKVLKGNARAAGRRRTSCSTRGSTNQTPTIQALSVKRKALAIMLRPKGAIEGKTLLVLFGGFIKDADLLHVGQIDFFDDLKIIGGFCYDN